MQDTSVDDVLAIAGHRHGIPWKLVGPIVGGSQQGAYEIVGEMGRRAVLKWHRAHLPARQLRDTAVALEAARARGWPTSRWLSYGPLPGDGAYIIEEFIDGSRPTTVEGTLLDQLLDAVRLQAGARPETVQDWSAYIYRVVFEGEAGLAARMRDRPETAALLARLEEMVADGRGLALPSEDLVHGDFVLNNMIVSDGRPYLVDAAHAGKGTRAYDVATLLMETCVGGDYTMPSLNDQRRLEREGIAIAGRPAFLVCVAGRIIHLLVFGGDHWSDEVARATARCHSFLEGLTSASA